MQQSAEQHPEQEETLAMKPPADFSACWTFASPTAKFLRSTEKATEAKNAWADAYGQVSKSHDKVTSVKFQKTNRQCRFEKTEEEKELDRAVYRMINDSIQNAHELREAYYQLYGKELADQLSPAELAEHEAEVQFNMEQWYADQRSLLTTPAPECENDDELPAVEVEHIIIDELPAVELTRDDNELQAEVIGIVEPELPAVEVDHMIDELPAVELTRDDNELPAEEVIWIVEPELHQAKPRSKAKVKPVVGRSRRSRRLRGLEPEIAVPGSRRSRRLQGLDPEFDGQY
jgi:hypothetical protein